MTRSIRARLTAWYSLVVVIVVATGAFAVDTVQRRLAFERLDGEMQRLMLTLEGVMRNEFGEGLTLEAAAQEASIEVVAPARTLVLTRPDGTLLEMWGLAFERTWRPDSSGPKLDTVTMGSQRFRLVSWPVSHAGHRYVAAAIAPLAELEAEHAQMQRALVIGMLVALVVAAAGGWLVGHQLTPLVRMARQATAISDQNLGERLIAPSPHDELGRFAAAFNELLDRLATVIDGQRQFMADASHELRTPVSVVRTTAQVTLARDQRSEADYRESLAIVAEQSARLTRLVESMFLLSRAEARGLPLQHEPLYLDDLVAECVRALRLIAAERGIEILSTGKSEITYSGDDALLRQMITNLIENAIRHARDHGQVSVQIVTTPSAVTVTVADDGNGVPPGDRDRIFQRFVRLDATSTGAGLGLPIARWIAEAHGGTLTLDPSLSGATFRVTLPIS